MNSEKGNDFLRLVEWAQQNGIEQWDHLTIAATLRLCFMGEKYCMKQYREEWKHVYNVLHVSQCVPLMIIICIFVFKFMLV